MARNLRFSLAGDINVRFLPPSSGGFSFNFPLSVSPLFLTLSLKSSTSKTQPSIKAENMVAGLSNAQILKGNFIKIINLFSFFPKISEIGGSLKLTFS
jgi:hypothetical protein